MIADHKGLLIKKSLYGLCREISSTLLELWGKQRPTKRLVSRILCNRSVRRNSEGLKNLEVAFHDATKVDLSVIHVQILKLQHEVFNHKMIYKDDLIEKNEKIYK